MFAVSFMIGLVIVISSIFMLRSELNKATYKRAQLIEQSGVYKSEDLFRLLEDLQLSFNDMNNAFYDIVQDLEGRVSLSDKEIQDILDELVVIRQKIDIKEAEKLKVKQELSDNLKRMAAIKKEPPMVEVSNESDSRFDISLDDDVQIYEKTASKLGKVESKPSQMAVDQNDKSIDQITLMRSQGYSLTEIAKKLGMGMGEIQLLINMKHKSKS